MVISKFFLFDPNGYWGGFLLVGLSLLLTVSTALAQDTLYQYATASPVATPDTSQLIGTEACPVCPNPDRRRLATMMAMRQGGQAQDYYDALSDPNYAKDRAKSNFKWLTALGGLFVPLPRMPRLWGWGGAAKGASSVIFTITPKIAKQMPIRGWTSELIRRTINNPFAKRAATNKATGNAATAYFQKSGSYVVRDNVSGRIIQISNRFDPKWVPDATIINPYIPK